MIPGWIPPGAGPRVLGVKLSEPLTLGHVLLLAEEGSPVVIGGEILPGDLALAVFICSRPANVSRRDLRSRWLPLLMRWWGRASASRDWEAETETFAEWFAESARQPTVIRSATAGASKSLGAPWWVNRIATAMGLLGVSYAEATTIPAKVLGQLVIAFAEAEGRVECLDEAGHRFREECRRLDREKAMKEAA